MKDLIIRKFEHTDVDAFICLSKSSFADEAVAAGITLEDFERETRRIFRWKMIPYRLLTALMGVKWEAFVAEKGGKVVAGGMYIGRNKRMTLSNLMVDPEYRRQGIGQALLVRRLERLAERGFPYAITQVLETNAASLGNLRKQKFEVFNQYSVYEQSLPLPRVDRTTLPQITIRDIDAADRPLFREIEKGITPPLVLHIKGSAEAQYFLSGWQKLYDRFTGYSRWIKAAVAQGETIGFVCAEFQNRQQKGFIYQPIVADENLHNLLSMIQSVAAWLSGGGRESMILEIPDQRTQIADYLLGSGWKKQHTWMELIRWLDERSRPQI